MNEQNPWEKQLQSWTPRRPSADARARLFGPPRSYARRAELLSWLTPVAACVLTVMVAWSGGNRRTVSYDGKDHTTYAATLSANAASPFVLSRTDVNLQWNVWPHANSARVTNFSSVMTNR